MNYAFRSSNSNVHITNKQQCSNELARYLVGVCQLTETETVNKVCNHECYAVSGMSIEQMLQFQAL